MNYRDIALLLMSLLVGGLCALVVRSAAHNPHENPKSFSTSAQERGSAANRDHTGHQTNNHPVTPNGMNLIMALFILMFPSAFSAFANAFF